MPRMSETRRGMRRPSSGNLNLNASTTSGNSQRLALEASLLLSSSRNGATAGATGGGVGESNEVPAASSGSPSPRVDGDGALATAGASGTSAQLSQTPPPSLSGVPGRSPAAPALSSARRVQMLTLEKSASHDLMPSTPDNASPRSACLGPSPCRTARSKRTASSLSASTSRAHLVAASAGVVIEGAPFSGASSGTFDGPSSSTGKHRPATTGLLRVRDTPELQVPPFATREKGPDDRPIFVVAQRSSRLVGGIVAALLAVIVVTSTLLNRREFQSGAMPHLLVGVIAASAVVFLLGLVAAFTAPCRRITVDPAEGTVEVVRWRAGTACCGEKPRLVISFCHLIEVDHAAHAGNASPQRKHAPTARTPSEALDASLATAPNTGGGGGGGGSDYGGTSSTTSSAAARPPTHAVQSPDGVRPMELSPARSVGTSVAGVPPVHRPEPIVLRYVDVETGDDATLVLGEAMGPAAVAYAMLLWERVLGLEGADRAVSAGLIP